MPPPKFQRHLFLAAALLLPWMSAFAHPIPDLPVRTFFQSDGKVRIDVELDLRCFEPDPLTDPYTLMEEYEELTEMERDALIEKAKAYLGRVVGFVFEPGGEIEPGFTYRFTTPGGKKIKEAEDIVVLTASWETTVADVFAGYRIRALPDGILSVLFLNFVDGKKANSYQVLFPGEDSKLFVPGE